MLSPPRNGTAASRNPRNDLDLRGPPTSPDYWRDAAHGTRCNMARRTKWFTTRCAVLVGDDDGIVLLEKLLLVFARNGNEIDLISVNLHEWT